MAIDERTTAQRYYAMTCDDCHRPGEVSHNPCTLAARAEREGWVKTEDGQWLCHDCKTREAGDG